MPPLPKRGMAELSEAGGIRSRRFRTFDNYKLQIGGCASRHIDKHSRRHRTLLITVGAIQKVNCPLHAP